MVLINLFAGMEWKCRCREWTCGHWGWGGEEGTNLESSIDIYTLSCVKQIVGRCYIAQRAQLVLCDDLDRWNGGEGSRGKGYIYTYD